nr:MAG TPA: hypothetical protein [Caudoviricetes sp.]DAZ45287.1 MAG TPA: hypothetical protein [Caudoviricetes sp.]
MEISDFVHLEKVSFLRHPEFWVMLSFGKNK